jgi:hypothetical protein
MPLSDFRTAYSWQEAINLGPSLVRLAEELPGSEQLGLCWQVQQAMVDLPASIAQDLMEDNSNTRRLVILKLLASLELIDNIYPALDTAGVRAEVDLVADRIASDRFAETAAGYGNAMTQPSFDQGHTGPASSVPVVPDNGPQALPELEPLQAPREPVSLQIDVQPSTDQGSQPAPQENHVQPDSVQ